MVAFITHNSLLYFCVYKVRLNMQISARDEKLYGIRCLKCLQTYVFIITFVISESKGREWVGKELHLYRKKWQFCLISKLKMFCTFAHLQMRIHTPKATYLLLTHVLIIHMEAIVLVGIVSEFTTAVIIVIFYDKTPSLYTNLWYGNKAGRYIFSFHFISKRVSYYYFLNFSSYPTCIYVQRLLEWYWEYSFLSLSVSFLILLVQTNTQLFLQWVRKWVGGMKTTIYPPYWKIIIIMARRCRSSSMAVVTGMWCLMMFHPLYSIYRTPPNAEAMR